MPSFGVVPRLQDRGPDLFGARVLAADVVLGLLGARGQAGQIVGPRHVFSSDVGRGAVER
jgi:hypothetical protein